MKRYIVTSGDNYEYGWQFIVESDTNASLIDAFYAFCKERHIVVKNRNDAIIARDKIVTTGFLDYLKQHGWREVEVEEFHGETELDLNIIQAHLRE